MNLYRISNCISHNICNSSYNSSRPTLYWSCVPGLGSSIQMPDPSRVIANPVLKLISSLSFSQNAVLRLRRIDRSGSLSIGFFFLFFFLDAMKLLVVMHEGNVNSWNVPTTSGSSFFF